MSPSVHALVSISGGVILWQGLHSWQAGLASALAGFFIDLDHIVDYVAAGRRSWRVKKFLDFYRYFNEPYVYVPLHVWEAVPILSILAWLGLWPAWLVGLAFGLFHHLLLDQWANGLRLAGYFMSYRLAVGFKSEKIIKNHKGVETL